MVLKAQDFCGSHRGQQITASLIRQKLAETLVSCTKKPIIVTVPVTGRERRQASDPAPPSDQVANWEHAIMASRIVSFLIGAAGALLWLP
jgi:hypothetical protein